MRNRAWLLLAMGVVVGVACTRATLMAVHQEKEVVQLAQNMAASQVEVWPVPVMLPRAASCPPYQPRALAGPCIRAICHFDPECSSCKDRQRTAESSQSQCSGLSAPPRCELCAQPMSQRDGVPECCTGCLGRQHLLMVAAWHPPHKQ